MRLNPNIRYVDSNSIISQSTNLKINQNQFNNQFSTVSVHNVHNVNKNNERGLNNNLTVSNSGTANDFFNQLENQITGIRMVKKQNNLLSKNYNNNLTTLQYNQTPTKQINESSVLSLQASPNNFINISQPKCQQCMNFQKQNIQLMSMMKEQIQIAVKQYNERFVRILKEQTKQLVDLRKKFTNNQKNIIKIQKEFKGNGEMSKISTKQRSPSKLSLTKSSNRSMSPHIAQPHFQQQNKQKLTMLSKELSPAKIIRKYSQNDNIPISISQKLTSQTLMKDDNLFEDMNNRIKLIQNKLSQIIKVNRTEKINTKIQIIQKGLLNVFSARLKKSRSQLEAFFQKQQINLNSLYKEIQIISSKFGTMSGTPSNLITIGQKSGSQNLYTTYNPHLSATQQIGGFKNSNNMNNEFNYFQVNGKLKNLHCQIQELRQLAETLQTKQYKYDNYSISELGQSMQMLQKRVYNLQKGKLELTSKITQNESKLINAIEMSKYSKKSVNLKSANLSQTTIITANRNNSYSSNNIQIQSQIQEINQKNIKNQSSKWTGYTTKINSYSDKSNKSLISPHSEHSMFDGQQSGYSNYLDDGSYYNNRDNYDKYEQHEDYQESEQHRNQERFSHSSDQEQEQDEFFYPLDISSNISVEQPYTLNYKIAFPQQNKQKTGNDLPNSNIHRFMDVIKYRDNKPLPIEIDQTGYIKSAENGSYIYDRNMDGFEFNNNELQWLRQRGIIII